MTKNEKLFQDLVPRYEAAYLAANGRPLAHRLIYKDGYVKFVGTRTKARIAEFEKMCQNLEQRAEEQQKPKPPSPPSPAEQIEALEKMNCVLLDYIQMMQDELNSLVGIAFAHGWQSSRVEIGKRIRFNIHQSKQNVPDYIQQMINDRIQED